MRIKGRSLGGMRPFGYWANQASKLIKDPSEHAAIVQTHRMRKQGRSYREIAEALQKKVP